MTTATSTKTYEQLSDFDGMAEQASAALSIAIMARKEVKALDEEIKSLDGNFPSRELFLRNKKANLENLAGAYTEQSEARLGILMSEKEL